MELTLQGKGEKEIAMELALARGTVKSRLYRARDRLRKMLKIKEVV